MYKEIGISHAYTLEASFCGADCGEYANVHFSPRHLELMGRAVCDTVLDLCDPDPSKVIAVTKELMQQQQGTSEVTADLLAEMHPGGTGQFNVHSFGVQVTSKSTYGFNTLPQFTIIASQS